MTGEGLFYCEYWHLRFVGFETDGFTHLLRRGDQLGEVVKNGLDLIIVTGDAAFQLLQLL